MSILIEAISVIVRNEALAARYPGGVARLRGRLPQSTRSAATAAWRESGFLSPRDVRFFVEMLESHGLVGQHGAASIDIAIVDQNQGPRPLLPVAGLRSPARTARRIAGRQARRRASDRAARLGTGAARCLRARTGRTLRAPHALPADRGQSGLVPGSLDRAADRRRPYVRHALSSWSGRRDSTRPLPTRLARCPAFSSSHPPRSTRFRRRLRRRHRSPWARRGAGTAAGRPAPAPACSCVPICE